MTAVATLAGADLALWVARIADADLGPDWNQGPDYVMIGDQRRRAELAAGVAAMRALVWSVYGDNVPDEVAP